MKLVFFMKPECDICARWLETIQYYVDNSGVADSVEIEQVDATTPEGSVRLYENDFGHIPSLLGTTEDDAGDIGSDAQIWWDGKPKWQELIEWLQGLEIAENGC